MQLAIQQVYVLQNSAVRKFNVSEIVSRCAWCDTSELTVSAQRLAVARVHKFQISRYAALSIFSVCAVCSDIMTRVITRLVDGGHLPSCSHSDFKRKKN